MFLGHSRQAAGRQEQGPLVEKEPEKGEEDCGLYRAVCLTLDQATEAAAGPAAAEQVRAGSKKVETTGAESKR